MHNSGSILTPFDPEIERDACAIRREVKEATLAQRIIVKGNPHISSDSEEEITMVEPVAQTMGDYCRPIDATQVFLDFIPVTSINFNINHYML